MNDSTGPWDAALIDLFRSEVETHSETLSAALLALERAPRDTSRIDAMMRAAHSIKGAARVVGVELAVPVAHVMEDCFVAAQKGTLGFTPADVDALLRGVDLLGKIAAATSDPSLNFSEAFEGAVQTAVGELRDVLVGRAARDSRSIPAALAGAASSPAPSDGDVTIAFPALLDAAAAETIRRQLVAALDSGRQTIRFDLTATKDLDAQGLALLAAAGTFVAARPGASLRLAGVSAEMTTVLQVTGLDASFAANDRHTSGTP